MFILEKREFTLAKVFFPLFVGPICLQREIAKNIPLDRAQVAYQLGRENV